MHRAFYFLTTMLLNLDAPTPLGYFRTLVQCDDTLPLLEAAAAIAQDECPELDLQQVLGEVDQWLARLRRRLPADASELCRLRVLNRFFFSELGFGLNVNDYHDPGNSHLHRVLSRRQGIPISLAVVWLELACGIGLKAQAVPFPGHFLCKVLLPLGVAVIDPCTGHSLSREVLLERLEPLQRHSLGHVSEGELPLGLYLQTTSARNVLARMLHNLKDIYTRQSDWQRLLAVQNRLVVLLPGAWAELRDRGHTLAALGHNAAAMDDLRTYLAQAHNAFDRDSVRAQLVQLQRTPGRA